MTMSAGDYTDIHCRIVPGNDDGATDLATSIAIARLAGADSMRSLFATPHQLGNNSHVTATASREGLAAVQAALDYEGIEVSVVSGADGRIEPDQPKLLKQGKVVTLAGRGKHVLLDLPRDADISLRPILAVLDRKGLSGILPPLAGRGRSRFWCERASEPRVCSASIGQHHGSQRLLPRCSEPSSVPPNSLGVGSITAFFLTVDASGLGV